MFSPAQLSRSKFSKVMSYDAYLWLEKFLEVKQAAIPAAGRAGVTTAYAVKSGRFYFSQLLEKIAMDILRCHGFITTKVNNSGRLQKTASGMRYVRDKNVIVGEGDIRATGNGRMLSIEVKINDRQSAGQTAYQAAFVAAGGTYAIIHTVDELLKVLNIDMKDTIDLSKRIKIHLKS